MTEPAIHGVDFTSAPTRRKPITIASGRIDPAVRDPARLVVEGIETCAEFAEFERWLLRPGPWIGGFDFPFGLPRELVVALGWPARADASGGAWQRMLAVVAAMPRAAMIAQFRAFCDARPAGVKFARRETDRPAGSSPSMKWVNPPVAQMLHAGAPRLLAAGVHLPGLHDGDRTRVALEAYPGQLARELVGRASYKSDERARQTPERRAVRERIVAAIESGAHTLAIAVSMARALRERCVDDASGDALDAVLCAVQAAWANQRRDEGFGLPDRIDPIEGWIVATPHAPVSQAPTAAAAPKARSRRARRAR